MTGSGQSDTIPFVWRGVELRTIGHLIEAIAALKTEPEAQEFIAEFRRCDPKVADENAGYITGYLEPEKAERLRRWMGTPHPIFGMGTPTPDEAMAAGERQAERAADQ